MLIYRGTEIHAHRFFGNIPFYFNREVVAQFCSSNCHLNGNNLYFHNIYYNLGLLQIKKKYSL